MMFTVLMHICQGNYAVGPDYDGQIGHRYFDAGRYKADIVAGIDCDGFLIEHDMTPHYEGLLGNRQLGVGAVDVQDPNVETIVCFVTSRSRLMDRHARLYSPISCSRFRVDNRSILNPSP
jgi:methionine synthase II (cobalamin-independent)